MYSDQAGFHLKEVRIDSNREEIVRTVSTVILYCAIEA